MTVLSLRANRATLDASSRVVSQVVPQQGWSFLWLLLAFFMTACAPLPDGLGSSATAPGSTGQAHILITSSPTLLPLISATAALFERQHPQVQIDIHKSELLDGLNEVVSQQADIAATIRYAAPSISSVMNLTDQLIGIVPFTIISQSGIALPSLSYEQILGIFSTGTITNWKQVGGPDQKIVIVEPPMGSDVRFLFREEMLGGASEMSGVLEADSLEMLPQLVAGMPGSVSYLPGPLLTANVHMIAVDGVQPTSETITTGHYPFWSFMHLFTEADIVDPGAGETDGGNNQMRTMYLHFLQSPAGDHLAQQLGYIPLSEIQIPPRLEPPTANILLASVSA